MTKPCFGLMMMICDKLVQTPGMSHLGQGHVLSLHAIGFVFEISEDTVSCPETQPGPTGLMPEKEI